MATEYSLAPEVKRLAERVKEIRSEVSHINVDAIAFIRVEGKNSPKNKIQPASISKVTGVYVCLVPYEYILRVYDKDWDDLTEAKQALVIYHELLHMGPDGELIPHTVQDFRSIIEEYGLDWFENPDTPNILQEDLV